MKRVFVAIDIPPECKRLVARYIKNLEKNFKELKVTWARDEKLHITLKFFGELDKTKLDLLQKILSETSRNQNKFSLSLKNPGVFPNNKRARVLWIGMDDKENVLQNLKKKLDEKMIHLGFQDENRKFKPHLTIARLREPQKSADLIRHHLIQQIKPVGFQVHKLVIYESELKPTGAIYKFISKFDLI